MPPEPRSPSAEEDPLRFALEEIAYLERIIDGMPREGVPGLKSRVAKIEKALEAVGEKERLEKARHEGQEAQIEQQRRQLSLLWKTLAFLGPGGIIGIISFIVYAVQHSGGG